MSDVTRILAQIDSHDSATAAGLLALVYDELRKLAVARLAHEKPGQTLQATALVHEAYLRLVNVHQAPHWNSRGHFFSAASEAMRRILVEQARRKMSLKGGGQWKRVELTEVGISLKTAPEELLELDEALGKLVLDDAESAEIARLRLFAGVSLEETALALGISRSTASRRWTYARAFLQFELHSEK